MTDDIAQELRDVKLENKALIEELTLAYQAIQNSQDDLQAIFARQQREEHQFRLLFHSTGTLEIYPDLPEDMSDVASVEHRRVTPWQHVNFSEEEENEGN